MKKLLVLGLAILLSGGLAAQVSLDKEIKRDAKPNLESMKEARKEQKNFKTRPEGVLRPMRDDATRNPQLILVNSKKNTGDPTKATIILDVDLRWGDDDLSGYQLLIDTTATAYGTIIPEEGPLTNDCNISANFYNVFKYKVPANADASCDPEHYLLGPDGIDQITIPAGIADVVIVNPTPGSKIWIATEGRFDDYKFLGGVTYTFKVIKVMSADGVNFGDGVVLTYPIPNDMAVVDVTLPESGVLPNNADITITIQNHGEDAASEFNLYYQINDRTIVGPEAYSGAVLNYGDSANFTFATKADLSIPNFYTVRAWVQMAGDLESENDTAMAYTACSGSYALPFHEDFSSTFGFEAKWRSEAPERWSLSEYNWNDEEEIIGCAAVLYDTLVNDYLITKNPVTMAIGEHYFNFWYNGFVDIRLRNLSVLYGTSDNPEEMTELFKIDSIMSNIWIFRNQQFNISEAGNYYFAILSNTIKSTGGLGVDEINIARGTFVGAPELSLSLVSLPIPTCGLTNAESIDFTINNNGTAIPDNFTVYHQINDETAVSAVRTDKLILGEAIQISIPNIDLSAVKSYNIKVWVGNIDSDLKDDTIKMKTANFSPTTIPYNTDFTTEASRLEWNPTVLDKWEIENESFYSANAGIEDTGVYLMSRCVDLEATSYRFEFVYSAGWGIPSWDLFIPASWEILYGKVGTDPSTWNTRKFEEYAVDETSDFMITIESAGDYVFAFMCAGDDFTLSKVSVTALPANDIRVNEWETNLAQITPLSQINSMYTFSYQVENRGNNAVEANIDIKEGSVEMGTAKANIAIGETMIIDVDVTFENIENVANKTFNSVVSIIGQTDAIPEDNVVEDYSFKISDTLWALDYIVEMPENGVGAKERTVTIGSLFTLNTIDTITAVDLGLCPTVDAKIAVVIHKVNSDTIEEQPILRYETDRGLGGTDWTYVNISDRILEAGTYFIGVHQMEAKNLSLAYDEHPSGFFYIQNGTDLALNNSMGNIGIRPILGHNGVIRTKDIEVVSIDKPIFSEGIFSANEEVLAIFVNNTAIDAENVPVTCTIIDGVTIAGTIALIPAFGTAEFSFEVDLSVPGTYVIDVTSNLEGDQVPSNNTLRKTVISVVPADPYIMDFESCNDFIIDRFNPIWKSIDGDGEETGGITQGGGNIDFPNNGQPYGFMAFNPTKTTPALLGNTNPEGSTKFGISMFKRSKESNDSWLISPKLKLPADNSQVVFQTMSYSDAYGLEKYNVLISTTNDSVGSFTKIGETMDADTMWTETVVDLSAYDEQEVYIAIQCVSVNNFMFMIDNIVVSKPEYIITFNENGGEGLMNIQEFEHGIAQKLTKNTYTRTAYTFKGWSTTETGEVEYADQARYTTTENATLYAVWEEGVGIESVYDAKLNLYPNPVVDKLYIEDYNPNTTQFIIMNSLGKIEMIKSATGESIISLDLSNLSAGIYILQIQANDGSILTRKFIKK